MIFLPLSIKKDHFIAGFQAEDLADMPDFPLIREGRLQAPEAFFINLETPQLHFFPFFFPFLKRNTRQDQPFDSRERRISRFCPAKGAKISFFCRSMLGIALVPEGRHVFPFLTVRENLELGGFKSRNDSAKIRRKIGEIFDMFPRLSERTTQNAGTLSGGEQQMLVLGRAMMSEPQLLCLDEPSLGLAPMVVQDIFRTIRAINAAGTSVLLVEQNARYALETASRGYVLQTGSVIASGSCADLKQNPRVQEAYLGRIATAAVS